MKKNRTIPFGYVMCKGEIMPDPVGSQAVREIFTAYLKGSSLSEIAGHMSILKISYNGFTFDWNKNMIKRILENEKYLGSGEYDALIDKNVFIGANNKKKTKATTLNEIPKELQGIRSLTYCAECSHKLSRQGGNRHSKRWDCLNPECSKFGYRLTDNMIIGTVLNTLNSAIANSDLLDTENEVSTYNPSLDVKRQQNEINRLLELRNIDFDTSKEEIFKLAKLKYDCCGYSDKPKKTTYLKELLVNKQQLNTLDIDLLKSCVSRILIGHFYTIEIEFINGVIIKNITERKDTNDSGSAEC